MRTLALEACEPQKLFRFGNDQLKLTQLPIGTLSRQQEQLPQVQSHEDHEAPKSPGSGMSSEDLAPHLGERWKREAARQVPAEVGMCASQRGSTAGWMLSGVLCWWEHRGWEKLHPSRRTSSLSLGQPMANHSYTAQPHPQLVVRTGAKSVAPQAVGPRASPCSLSLWVSICRADGSTYLVGLFGSLNEILLVKCSVPV